MTPIRHDRALNNRLRRSKRNNRSRFIYIVDFKSRVSSVIIREQRRTIVEFSKLFTIVKFLL